MNAPSRFVDHLVIGGGPAGAMMGIKLAEAGRRVTLIERESGAHDKVCGEFLSREAIGYLHGISIFPADLGAATIRSVRLSSGSRIVGSALPFHALSLSRRVLDDAMLARAEAAGCEVQRGAAVENLKAHETGWLAHLARGECIAARTVFLACGKHDLRGWNRGRGVQSDLVAFKLHMRLNPAETEALRESIELFLFAGGYGGLVLIEKEAANLCLVVRRSRLQKHGGWRVLFNALLAENHHLRRRLLDAEPLHPRPLSISPIPYGYVSTHSDGLWRIGDQAAVIPSFTGDGISIALHSASLAASMYLNGRSADAYMRRLSRQVRGPMRLATWFSRAMVTGPGQTVMPTLLTLMPDAMRWIAAATRVPARVLLYNRNEIARIASALSGRSSHPRTMEVEHH
jgi:flavin-dependent dehydrogenase